MVKLCVDFMLLNGPCVDFMLLKRLKSLTEAPQLGFASRKHVFSLKTTEIHSIGVRDPLK